MDETDVVIVGAGAGGLAAAWRLTTRGARVILLEAGRRFDPNRDYPQIEPDFEIRTFPYDPVNDERGKPRFGYGRRQPVGPEWGDYRSWNAGQGRFVADEHRQYQQYGHVKGVGGSTLRFQAEAHRFHRDAFRMASLFGAGADWPVAAQELEPYYDVAEEQIGVAGPEQNPWRPRSRSSRLAAHPVSYASRRLAKGFAAVGANLIANDLAILSDWFRGRPPCNYCNACNEGCPLGDRGSADVTFLPGALATRKLDLRTAAQALEVEVNDRGRPTGVVYADSAGARRRVRADVVILAGGAIETARLLLLSTSRSHPSGLGNASEQVGRNLTESLFWVSVGLLPERVDSFGGVPIDATAWDFAMPQSRDGWVGGFRLATAHGAMNLRGPGAYAERLVPGFGLDHQRRVAEVFGHGVSVLAVGEWLPNRWTRVDLDPSHQDAQGLPVARITSWLGDNERSLLRRMAETVRGIFDAAGGAEIVEEVSALDLFSATHTLGTCRMGRDPETSVADAQGFCHGIPNLAFADGSLMPSSGTGDSPFLTITALALRTADAVLDRKGSLS